MGATSSCGNEQEKINWRNNIYQIMGKVNSKDVEKLFERQFVKWPMAKNNFEALKGVKVKEVKVNNATFKVQFNPARIVSSAAKVDAKSLKERKCFLCAANRPAEQEGIEIDGDYTILINPFPIFPRHLTIPCNEHVDQRIYSRIGDMMDIAAQLDDYILFYNGPKCGASAPDHMHFQAGNKGFMTFDADLALAQKEEIAKSGEGELSLIKGLSRVAFLIENTSTKDAEDLFKSLYKAFPLLEGEDEPMLNILCWYGDGKWTIAVFPRVKHRPSFYYAEGDANLLITPASVDMGGVFITPLEKDFNKVTSADIQNILNEVCYDDKAVQEVINRLKNNQ